MFAWVPSVPGVPFGHPWLPSVAPPRLQNRVARATPLAYFATTSTVGFAMMNPLTGSSGVNEITPAQL